MLIIRTTIILRRTIMKFSILSDAGCAEVAKVHTFFAQVEVQRLTNTHRRRRSKSWNVKAVKI